MEICEIREETVEHALLQCDWALAVWYGMNIGYKVDRQKITSLDRWFEEVVGLWEKDKEGKEFVLRSIAVACWKIWK